MDNTVKKLEEGNQRFISGDTKSREIRPESLAGGQSPHTIILTCADSRVPPELIFDQDLGELFVIRVAGNSCTDEGLGSIEYAVANLGTQTIIVMGHSSCGAVGAAVSCVETKEPLPTPALEKTIAPIIPAVLAAEKNGSSDKLADAISLHAKRTCDSLLNESSLLKAKHDAGEIEIKAAVYDLKSGEVKFL